jgi:HlyD family secretion protein
MTLGVLLENVAAQRAIVERLHNGSRPEEIAQARANVASAQADTAKARLHYERTRNLSVVCLQDRSEVRAVSQEEVDNAKATLDAAQARLTVNQQALDLALAGPRREDIAEAEAKLALYQQALDLALAGPRREDIAQAEAQLRGFEAQAAFLRQQLADAQLTAPATAVVRTRLLEPGELALRAIVGNREPGILRQRVQPARQLQARTHSLGPGAV